jgi:CheY-like chemotaxis protein
MDSSKTILLIEDNPSDIELTRRAFEKAGIHNRMDVAVDGEAASEYLFGTSAHIDRKLPVLPSLILLDLKLPKVTGLEVLKQLRKDERTRSVPVVIFTNSKLEADVAAAFDLGANSYVQKPVDFDHFFEVLRTVCSYWLNINESAPLSVRQTHIHGLDAVPHRKPDLSDKDDLASSQLYG